MNRKKIAIIIGILCIFILAIFLAFSVNNSTDNTTEPERDSGPSIGLIDNNNQLYNAFTLQDFSSIRYELTNYVISQNGDPYTYQFEIKEVISPYRDGDTTTINTILLNHESKKVKDVTVIVKIPSNGDPASFSIPAENYSIPLYSGD